MTNLGLFLAVDEYMQACHVCTMYVGLTENKLQFRCSAEGT